MKRLTYILCLLIISCSKNIEDDTVHSSNPFVGEWMIQSASERFVSGDYEGFLNTQDDLEGCDLLQTIVFGEDEATTYSYNINYYMKDCAIYGETTYSYTYQETRKDTYEVTTQIIQSKTYYYNKNGEIDKVITTDYDDDYVSIDPNDTEVAEISFLYEDTFVGEYESGSTVPKYKSIAVVVYSRI